MGVVYLAILRLLSLVERPLLQVAVPLCEEFYISYSSLEGGGRPTGHEGILQSTDSQMFWKPEPPNKDPNPCMEVVFHKNHIVTSIELKGTCPVHTYVSALHCTLNRQR